MVSYVVAGASRGIGVSIHRAARQMFLFLTELFFQYEFVVQLLAKGNLVIALARNPSSGKLAELKDKNLHIVKGDITDHHSLKVRYYHV